MVIQPLISLVVLHNAVNRRLALQYGHGSSHEHTGIYV